MSNTTARSWAALWAAPIVGRCSSERRNGVAPRSWSVCSRHELDRCSPLRHPPQRPAGHRPGFSQLRRCMVLTRLELRQVPTVPAPVVAQAWRGGGRQARLSRRLLGCDGGSRGPLANHRCVAGRELSCRSSLPTAAPGATELAPGVEVDGGPKHGPAVGSADGQADLRVERVARRVHRGRGRQLRVDRAQRRGLGVHHRTRAPGRHLSLRPAPVRDDGRLGERPHPGRPVGAHG